MLLPFSLAIPYYSIDTNLYTFIISSSSVYGIDFFFYRNFKW